METHIKQRLVGSLVLIALLVVFFPYLTNSAHLEYQAVHMPDPPDLSRVKQFEQLEAKKLPRFDFETELAELNEDIDSAVQETRETKAKLTEARKIAEAKRPAWAIQVARLSQEANAIRLQKELLKEGFQVKLLKHENNKLPFQVLIEPNDHAMTADQLLKVLEQKIKIKGIVLQSANKDLLANKS